MRLCSVVFEDGCVEKFGVAPDFVSPVRDGEFFVIDKGNGTLVWVAAVRVKMVNVYDEFPALTPNPPRSFVGA